MKNHHAKLLKKWTKAKPEFAGINYETFDCPYARILKLEDRPLHALVGIDLLAGEKAASATTAGRVGAKDFTIAAIDGVLTKFQYAYPIHQTTKNATERTALLTSHLPLLSGMSGEVIILDVYLEAFSVPSHLMFECSADAQRAIDAGLLKSMA